MEGRRSSNQSKQNSSSSQAPEQLEEPPKEQEEQEQEDLTNKPEQESQEMNVMQLRRTKQQRSTYSFRTDRRASRGPRGKKMGGKRKRAGLHRGRKRPNMGSEGADWDRRSDSDSDDSIMFENPTQNQGYQILQRFLYKPGVPWPDLSPYLGKFIEIRVASEYISLYNKQVAQRLLWGNQVYTSDSDIVAMIHHVGLLNIWDSLPAHYQGIAVIARVTKGRNNYVSCVRNGIKSQKYINYQGHSIKPEKIQYLTSLGKIEELVQMAEKMPSEYPKLRQKPDLNPKEMRIIPGTLLVFDLSCEMASPYLLDYFGDKGCNQNEFVSAKLKKCSLYIETHKQRFELSFMSQGDQEQIFEHQDKYRWAKVKPPLLSKGYSFMEQEKVPLEEKWLEVRHKQLDWADIEWSSKAVFIKDQQFGPLTCFKYITKHD